MLQMSDWFVRRRAAASEQPNLHSLRCWDLLKLLRHRRQRRQRLSVQPLSAWILRADTGLSRVLAVLPGLLRRP